MLGNAIAHYRKKLGLTQEQLAQRLDVTNQAVSKWETDQCCPDVAVLPRLADIFDISLDALFGRPEKTAQPAAFPWENDKKLHIAVFEGHHLLASNEKKNRDCTVTFDGPVRDVHCLCNLYCDGVGGDVNAGGYVECSGVEGNVNAGGYVECAGVEGDVNAGGYVECGGVEGDVKAGSYVECGDVEGDVNAGAYVECGDVEGDVSAMTYVECGDIGGNVSTHSINH